MRTQKTLKLLVSRPFWGISSIIILLINSLFFLPILSNAYVPGELLKPLDIFLAIDQSGSMEDTDPYNIRIRAASYFVDFLASQISDLFNHRLGIIHYGDRSPEKPEDEVLPLIELKEKLDINRAKTFLKPMNLGNTSFIRALRKSLEGFEKAGDLSGRQKVIVFFTDGEPFDKRKLSKAQYFNEIREFLNQKLSDCNIYVVGIGIGREDLKYWEEITKGNTYLLTKMDERELDKIYSSIIVQLLRAPEIRWDEIPPEGLEVKVEPYLESLTFLILKENPDVKVVISKPDGKEISITESNVRHFISGLSEIYTINEPDPGNWRCKIEKGRGKVEVGKVIIPIEIRLLSPKMPHPQGKPLQVKASFLRRDGSLVKEHPAYRLWLGAKVVTPEGVESFEFTYERTGIFSINKVFSTLKKGVYEVSFTMKGGHLIVSEVTIPLKLEVMPYVNIVKPTFGHKFSLRSDPEIEIQLLLENNLIDPSQLFLDDPGSILWAQIEYKGQIIRSISLPQDKNIKGVFRGEVKGLNSLHDAGEYKVIIQLGGRMKTGELYEMPFPEETSFYKGLVGVDHLIYRWYWFLTLLIILILVYKYIQIGIENHWWLGWINCPQLSGYVEIIKKIPTELGEGQGIDEEKEEVQLRGRKMRKKLNGIGLTILARRVEEIDSMGDKSVTEKIYLKWDKSSRPEEELTERIDIPISENILIRYYYQL